MKDLAFWQPFDIKATNGSDFFKCICTLEEDLDPTKMVKWKTSEQQVVIRAKEYFYKIYKLQRPTDPFYEKVREYLGQIYEEEYGLHWKVKTLTLTDTGEKYQVEQREVLDICPDNMPFNQIFSDWRKTLDLLEKKLQLDKICVQLVDIFPKLYRVKLVRDCLNKSPDYGIDKNGNIILLDDSDWFLALVDKDGNWLEELADSVFIHTSYGEFVFASQELNFNDVEAKIGEHVTKWALYSKEEFPVENKDKFIDAREKMLQDNINFLVTGNEKVLFSQGQGELLVNYYDRKEIGYKENE